MADISFRQTAHDLDPLYAVERLSDLFTRFRYAGTDPKSLPPPSVTLRSCGQRLTPPCVRVEFLHYNTWLLAAKVDLATVLKSVAHARNLVACLGLSVAEVVARLVAKVSTSELCDAIFPPVFSVCGVSPNPANDACKLIGSAAELAAKLIAEVGDDVGVILDVLGLGVDVLIDVVLEMVGVNLTLTVQEKPERDARASEIGKEVFAYDWVSLCEVWDAPRRDLILAEGPPVQSFTGPPEPGPGQWEALGAGLLVFSPTGKLTGGTSHTYSTAGVKREMTGGCDFGRIVDSDLWAKKGVQHTTLDVGFGKIDLYSTHLYNGGDMLDAPILGLAGPSESEKAAVRAAQVSELVSFIASTHDPRHIAIIAGDFNIAASSLEYPGLAGGLRGIQSTFPGFVGALLDFDDWWGIAPFTRAPKPFDAHGHTSRHGDGDGEIIYTFDSVCKVFPASVAHPDSPNANDYFFDDRQPQDQKNTGDRIDFIFVERQTSLHPYLLDVSRVRRRAFKRTGTHPPTGVGLSEVIPQTFLSDHLGLEVTLFASPLHHPA